MSVGPERGEGNLQFHGRGLGPAGAGRVGALSRGPEGAALAVHHPVAESFPFAGRHEDQPAVVQAIGAGEAGVRGLFAGRIPPATPAGEQEHGEDDPSLAGLFIQETIRKPPSALTTEEAGWFRWSRK